MNFLDNIKNLFKPKEPQNSFSTPDPVSRAISTASNVFSSVGNFVNKQYQKAQQQAQQQAQIAAQRQAQQQEIARQRQQQIQAQQQQQRLQQQQFLQEQTARAKQGVQNMLFNRQQEQLAKGLMAKEGMEKRKSQLDNLLTGVKAMGSKDSRQQYLDPTSGAEKNFWNTPLAQNLAKTQERMGDPGQYWAGRGMSNVNKDVEYILNNQNIIHKDNPQAKQQLGEDVGYVLRGASKINPLLLPAYLGIDKKGQQNLRDSAPTTDRQKQMQDLGLDIFATMATAGIGGGSPALNVARRLSKAAVMAPIINTGSTLLTQGRLPTLEETKQASTSGIQNSWKYALSDLAIDKTLGHFSKTNPELSKYIQDNVGDPFKNKEFKEGIKRQFVRAFMEILPENTLFTLTNHLSSEEKESFFKNWINNLPGEVVGNLVFAGLSSVANVGGYYTGDIKNKYQTQKAEKQAQLQMARNGELFFPGYKTSDLTLNKDAITNKASDQLDLELRTLKEILSPGSTIKEAQTKAEAKPEVKVEPIKKGYVRLYRGLSKEYDPAYDPNKTEPPQGYDAFTDNPALARKYAGEDGYIYYVDLPKNKQTQEIIGADGERGLFFNNGKKAALDGVGGKEYLVYRFSDDFKPDNIKLYESQIAKPEVKPEEKVEGFTPLEDILNKRASDLDVTPNKDAQPQESDFRIPEDYKEQGLQKSVTSLKQIANPNAVDRLLVEGYHPGTIKNILSKASDRNKVLNNENYAYNYFKKVAKDQNIKIDSDVETYLKPELQDKTLDGEMDDYMAGLVKSEGEKPSTKPVAEILQQEKQPSTSKLDNKPVSEILSPETKPEARPEAKLEAKPRVQLDPVKNVKEFSESTKIARTKEDVEHLQASFNNAVDRFFQEEFGGSLEKWIQAVDDKEAGKVTPQTKAMEKFFQQGLVRPVQEGFAVEPLENYWFRQTPEQIKAINSGQTATPTYADQLVMPSFLEHRTDADFDYDKTPEVLKAHYAESLKNTGLPEDKQRRIETSQAIRKEYQAQIEKELSKFQKAMKDVTSTIKRGFEVKVDVVGKAQEDYQKDLQHKIDTGQADAENRPEKVKYDSPKKNKVVDSLNTLNRSVAERSELAGNKFRNAFFKPFRQVQTETNKYASELEQLSTKELIERFGAPNLSKEQGKAKVDDKVVKEKIIARELSNFHASKMRVAVNDFEQKAGEAEFVNPQLKDLANEIFDEFVGDDIRGKTYTDKILSGIRRQQGRALVGFNFSSAIQNLFEVGRGFSLVEVKNAEKGIKRVFSGEDFTKKYGIEQRTSTALEKSGVSKFLSKFDDAAYWMFTKTEDLKDQFFLASFEEQGKSKGLKGEDLEDFVIKKFDRYAIKYGQGQTTGLFKNPLLKTAFQFGQYAQKELVNVIDMTIDASKGDRGAQQFLKKYLLYSAARMGVLKATIGTIGFGGETGTPIDIVSDLMSGELPTSPAAQVMIDAFTRASDLITNNERDEYEKQKQNKSLIKAASGLTGLPVNQVYWKTGRSIQDILSGEHQTGGGNVASPTSKDAFSVMKMLMLGPSYDPNAQDYYKRYEQSVKSGNVGEASLNKNESQIFRSTPEGQKEDYYYKTIEKKTQKNTKKKELKDILEAGKEGTKEKEPGFLDKIFGKKEETIAITEPAKTEEDQKFYKSVVEGKLDSNLVPTKEEVRYGWFENKTVNSEDFADREQTFNRLAQVYNNEYYNDEQKKVFLEESGASEAELNYFLIADKNETPKLQAILKALPADPEERIKFLAAGRMKVGGKQIITSGIYNYLEDRGYITEKERKFLSSTQYDELSQEFYWTGDSGGGKKITLAQAKKLFPDIDFEVTSSVSKSSFKSFLQSLVGGKTKVPTVEEILGKPVPKQKEGLWFDVR